MIGQGFFEQYKVDEDFVDYGLMLIELGGEIINIIDFICCCWFDNDFYGSIYSLYYNSDDDCFCVILGGGYYIYQGVYFGEIIWVCFVVESEICDCYYDNDVEKWDFNIFIKFNYVFGDCWDIYLDF